MEFSGIYTCRSIFHNFAQMNHDEWPNWKATIFIEAPTMYSPAHTGYGQSRRKHKRSRRENSNRIYDGTNHQRPSFSTSCRSWCYLDVFNDFLKKGRPKSKEYEIRWKYHTEPQLQTSRMKKANSVWGHQTTLIVHADILRGTYSPLTLRFCVFRQWLPVIIYSSFFDTACGSSRGRQPRSRQPQIHSIIWYLKDASQIFSSRASSRASQGTKLRSTNSLPSVALKRL